VKYQVTISGSYRKVIVEADNSDKAKRKACKCWQIKVSDRWCGLKGMHAERIES
jgi:hypothetical protein